MSDLFTTSLPWWEFILRGVCVYLFLLIAFRLSGKRQIGQFSAFDLVLLLIISDAVQNSMTGGDNSLIGGLIIAGTLVLLNWVLDYLGFKNKAFSKLTVGSPVILIHNGIVNHKVLEQERISDAEFKQLLRSHDVIDPKDVQIAILEVSGKVSIIEKSKSKAN